MVKQFRNTEMTNKGFSVSNKAALGQTKFTTTRAVSTDVDLSSYKEEDLKNLTKLPGEVDSGIISDYDIEGNNVSAIKIDFNNSNFPDGYTVRAVGIYAKEENGGEFLHSITVSDTPVIIPAVSGNVFDGFILTVAIFTGNNKNISIKLADENTATVKYVDDKYKAAISYTDEQVKLLNNKIANIDLSGAVKSAKDYTDSKVNGLNVGQYAKATDVDRKINAIDLSKPEKNANIYTDGKINDFKNNDEDITAVKNFTKGVKISGNSLYVNDDKLMYRDKPVLIANAPNAPKLSVSIDKDTGNVNYQITPPTIDGGASIVGYTLYYKKQVDSNWQTMSLDESSLIGQINVDKGVNYQFKAIAKNYAGNSYDSDVQTILTARPPQNVSVDVKSDYPNGLKYNITVGDDGNANVTGYRIFYKKDTDTDWQMFPYNQNIGNILSVITNEKYQVKVKAQNVVGLSDESDIQKCAYKDDRIFGFNFSANNLTDDSKEFKQKSDFDKTGIWGEIKEETESNKAVLIKIPKFYIFRDENNVKISKVKQNDDWYLPKCFYDFEKNVECSYLGVSKYQLNIDSLKRTDYANAINSFSQMSFSNSIPANIRNFLKGYNNYSKQTYQMLDIHIVDVLLALYSIENKTNALINDIAVKSIMNNYRGINWGKFTWLLIDGTNYYNNKKLICDDSKNYSLNVSTAPYYDMNLTKLIYLNWSSVSTGYGGLEQVNSYSDLKYGSNGSATETGDNVNTTLATKII